MAIPALALPSSQRWLIAIAVISSTSRCVPRPLPNSRARCRADCRRTSFRVASIIRFPGVLNFLPALPGPFRQSRNGDEQTASQPYELAWLDQAKYALRIEMENAL
jgi:hypothetical protein